MGSIPETTLEDVVLEKTTCILSCLLTDVDGLTPLPGAPGSLTALTLDLYDETTGSVLNSRAASSILGVNGGSVSAGAVLTLTLAAADNVMADPAAEREMHVALIRWSTASMSGGHRLRIPVDNELKVT